MATPGSNEVVNDRALLALKSILDRIELDNRSLDGLADLMREAVCFEPITFAHGPGDDKALRRAHKLFDDIEATVDTAKRIFGTLSEEVAMVKDQMKSISLRNLLLSLPDDILSYILQYATRPNKMEEGTGIKSKTEVETIYDALSLSHVCSRFRSLILGNARIWNFLSDQFTNAEMALHCIKCAKGAPLDVYFDHLGRTHTGVQFESIVVACLTACEHWVSLTFGEASDKSLQKCNLQDFADNAATFARLTRGREFPSLASFFIDHSGCAPHLIDRQDEKFQPHLHWSLPSLASFDTSGIIPLPFNNTAKQVSLNYHQRRGSTLDTRQVQDFLASCTSLRSLRIWLNDWQVLIPNDTVDLHGIEEVEFHFIVCSMNVTRNICGAFYSRDLRNIVLDLDFLIIGEGYHLSGVPDFGVVVEELVLQHPYFSLRRLDVGLTPIADVGTQAPYLPPFTKLINLQHLKLLAPHFGWSRIKLLEIPIGIRIPALRSLTVVMELEEWKHVSKWVVQLMARLKAQGDLDRFERLRIHERHDNMRKPSDLEGDIHDYLPEDKILIEAMHGD